MSPTPRPETTGGLLRPDSLYASRYRIEQQIGRGGVGVVYEAHDESLNRPVAVKVVRAADDDDHRYAERFAREAQMQARIRSRHTVTIHEHGEVEGTVFLVTDLMPDGDLHSWLMREGPMPWRAALSVTAQVCEALEDTHRAGIAHRDVKPSNVLLWARTDGLIAFLCDFGIAAAIGDDTQRELTEVGAVVGSPAYMPPERLMGTGGDDERGDVYSAGCVLWSTLTGEAPYSGTDLDVMTQHVQGPVPQLATGDPVDDKIDALLRKVLAKDPADRLASAEEFRHELRKIHAAVAGAPPMSGLHPVPPSVAAAQPTVAVLPVAAPVPPGPPGPPGPAADQPADFADFFTGTGPGKGETRVRGAAPVTARPRGHHSRRRSIWFAAAVVAVVIGALTAAQAIDPAPRTDPGAVAAPDEPESAPASAGSSPPASGASAGSTPAEELLAVAVAPRVRTASDYRSVRFAYEPPEQVPGVEVRVEYLLDDTWTPAEPTLVRFTKAGGLTACIRARSVVETSAGAVTNSPVRKFCGTSAEPTIRIVASDKPCTALANGYAYSCQWYGVRLSGFEPGTAPLVDVLPAEGRSYCKVPVPGSTFECRKASIDKRGRAKIAQYVRIARTTELTMRAGSVSTTMTLQAP